MTKQQKGFFPYADMLSGYERSLLALVPPKKLPKKRKMRRLKPRRKALRGGKET